MKWVLGGGFVVVTLLAIWLATRKAADANTSSTAEPAKNYDIEALRKEAKAQTFGLANDTSPDKPTAQKNLVDKATFDRLILGTIDNILTKPEWIADIESYTQATTDKANQNFWGRPLGVAVYVAARQFVNERNYFIAN